MKPTSQFGAVSTVQVAPRVGAWIETDDLQLSDDDLFVAPRVGAWIETMYRAGEFLKSFVSHPVWVRGLKPYRLLYRYFPSLSHPVWVRGLKPYRLLYRDFPSLSHPVWVRGLKLCLKKTIRLWSLSHPVWVRGLKPYRLLYRDFPSCRTPCGCVD